ncbi:MAG: radical SAM protein, partial [Candidatus Freyarchaeota archaeon]
MNTMAKLRVLGAGARYDLCGHDTLLLSGVGRHWRGGLPGVYPAALPGGGFKNLLKVLFTNVCLHD